MNNIMEAYDSPDFKAIHNQADLVTPDGMPLVWGLRLLGLKHATRVYGPDLTPALLSAAELNGIPVGFYGASQKVLNRLLEVVSARWPKLDVRYAFSPPFRPLADEEDEIIVRDINSSGARILFIGLNTPKQDRWMAAHRGRVNAVMMGVGAAFDFCWYKAAGAAMADALGARMVISSGNGAEAPLETLYQARATLRDLAYAASAVRASGRVVHIARTGLVPISSSLFGSLGLSDSDKESRIRSSHN